MMKKNITYLLAVASLSFLFIGCAPKIVNVPIFEKGEEHIWLQRYAEDVSTDTYNHPAKIDAEKIDLVLDSIRFEERSFFKWYKKGNVFTKQERKKLAPLISKALAKAETNQWVHFAIMSRKDSYIGKTKQLTDGIAFVKDGKLNIVFLNINFEEIIANLERPYARKKERNYGDPRLISSTDIFIRLFSSPDNGYTRPAMIENDRFLSQEHNNWLIFDIKGIMMTRLKERETAKRKKIKSESLNISERLKILKDLREQELISAKEYKEKRKAILEDL